MSLHSLRPFVLASLAALLGCDGCGSGPGLVAFVGRVALADPSGCASAVDSIDTDWTQCHSIKRHFDPATGAAITDNAYHADALRPMRVTVELSYYRTDTYRLCSKAIFQTDVNGLFRATMQGCGEGVEALVLGRAYTQYRLSTENFDRAGYIRGIWKRDEAIDVFASLDSPLDALDDPLFTRDREQYSMPGFGFVVHVDREPAPVSKGGLATVNLGTQVLLEDPTDDAFGYLRQVFSSFSTMVELHLRLRNELGNGAAYYDKMFFEDPALTLGASYWISYTVNWAYGGKGGISLYRPDLTVFTSDVDKDGKPDGSTRPPIARLISSVGTLSHEFGHSLHDAVAKPVLDKKHYAFANALTRSGGTDYDWGHGYNQYQENLVALVEGVGNGLGQFLVTRCRGWNASSRLLGGDDPFGTNFWAADPACDANDGCYFHHVRWNLKTRGVTEGSADWNTRVARLQDLTDLGVSVGHRKVASSNEGRAGELICDMLDDDTDVSHAPDDLTRNRGYIPDFTYLVGEILDGVNVSATTESYPDTSVSAENVQLTFGQFLTVLQDHCPSCGGLSFTFGHDYNVNRLSIDAATSPQQLARTARDKGFMTDAQMRNLLRTNLMEQ